MNIADILCTVSIGIYTSISILLNTNIHHIVQCIMSSNIDIGWYTKSVSLVCAAYTRFKAFRQKVFIKEIKFKKSYILCGILWFTYILMTSYYVINPDIVYILDLQSFTWNYAPMVKYSVLMTMYNIVHNDIVSIMLIIFHCCSIYHVYKKQTLITSLPQSPTRKKNDFVSAVYLHKHILYVGSCDFLYNVFLNHHHTY